MTSTDDLLHLMFSPCDSWSKVTRGVDRNFGRDAAASFHACGTFFVALLHNGQYVVAQVCERIEHWEGIGQVRVGHDNGTIIRTVKTRRAAKALATRMNRSNA